MYESYLRLMNTEPSQPELQHRLSYEISEYRGRPKLMPLIVSGSTIPNL